VQKNNHLSFLTEKVIDPFRNRDTLEHPQICWMYDENFKPKRFFGLGYQLD
jgi:hypothetical protein